MGVVDFDPEKWSRANVGEAARPVTNLANLANLSRNFTEHSQHSQVASLPRSIRDGIAKLQVMKAPRTVRADRWPGIVTDAVSLVVSGWAGLALAKDWQPLHLFGAVTDATGDPHSDGLAVWLRGRKITALLDGCVAVEDGAGRAYFNRRDQVDAKFLWDLAR